MTEIKHQYSSGPAKLTGAERRKHPRLTIAVRVEFGSGHHFYCGRTRDVSAGGLFIETDVRLPVGTEVTVDLRIPGLHAPVSAEVVWLLVNSDGTTVGFGVRFTRLSSSVEQKLRRFMDTHAQPGYELSDPGPEEEEPAPRKGPPPLPSK